MIDAAKTSLESSSKVASKEKSKRQSKRKAETTSSVPSFVQSAKAYESWLRKQTGKTFVASDFAKKNVKLQDNAFSFLRGTYWRFAETILSDCPDLAACPSILAVGDIHLENFGMWRDADSRMVWGVNDFDEAAVMPYALDLVRLALSGTLARAGEKPSTKAICQSILAGYKQGIADPRPIILERDNDLLREELYLSPMERRAFWAKMQTRCFDRAVPAKSVPPVHLKALKAAMPDPSIELRFARRTAGTGSLGRPRFVAWGDWRGGLVLRESKLLCASAWIYSGKDATQTVLGGKIAGGAFRAPDPNYRVESGIVVRRLGPNSRKIEAKTDPVELLDLDLLLLMGRELAACHAGDRGRLEKVRTDVARRDAKWLRMQVEAAGRRLRADYKAWRKAQP
ncbi:DUF2252 family protein [Roseiarcaceae bacterium H3SJ34-1]|uniref:DUF2252 family protein n=1 Tax=Terripilifer ovatus TaxID=3032367 RepID=UPI003AB9996C|nr:DUF2252 family protein [Roseiarcaceae bacterium H3SJ34-1]